jgi:exopolyphosphatase/guanosine-5'-triphosphate,3'-diphosphate pyrophosphatase
MPEIVGMRFSCLELCCMERIGIIDLGSNTTRLMVMAYEPQRWYKLVDEVSETVRLAEGMKDDALLQPQPMRRSIEALRMFQAFCRGSGVEHVVAVGTSAVRGAANQEEFLEQLRAETGLELRVLSEEQEGYYGYLGVINSLPMTNGYVVDIGGGSTEVTEVYRRNFSRTFSQQVGIVRFTERYINSDPISKKDFRALEEGVASAFAELDWIKAVPGYIMIGLGGTVRNLARIAQKRENHPIGRIHGYILTTNMLDTIIRILKRSDQSEREAIRGLNRERADVILAGAVILRHLMQKGDFQQIQVSGEGLREGLFYEHFLGDNDPPVFANVREFSVRNLTRIYNYEEAHTRKVQEICLHLFDQLRPMHGYGAWERELLSYAALLHDIGVTVGYYDHHKHSAYLVLHSSLHGFTHREIALLALLVRLHRKGSVDTREFRSILAEDDEERAARLGALLRIAEYLERSKSQVVEDVHVQMEADGVKIQVEANGDATVELWDANRRANLFMSSFGCAVEIVE